MNNEEDKSKDEAKVEDIGDMRKDVADQVSKTPDSNLIAAWDISSMPSEEAKKIHDENFKKHVEGKLKFSFFLAGLNVGCNKMRVADGLLQMSDVAITFTSQQAKDETKIEIQHYKVYRTVYLFGNTLIYPTEIK